MASGSYNTQSMALDRTPNLLAPLAGLRIKFRRVRSVFRCHRARARLRRLFTLQLDFPSLFADLLLEPYILCRECINLVGNEPSVLLTC